MKRILFLITLLPLALVGGVLAYLNAAGVSFNYYFSTIELPLAVLLFTALTVGAVAGVLLSFAMVLRIRREKARLRHRLQLCEQEIKNLRDIPIKGPY